MNFSQEWDERFKENSHISIWPWSDLITFVMRYAKPHNTKFRVLELGCGAGANIPFFTSFNNVVYYAIDGSSTIIQRLKEKFPQIKDNLITGDFTQEIPFNDKFDLIFDRGALTCNSTQAIKDCLKTIYDKLNIDGKYIGIDLFSTLHSEFQKGNATEDNFTKTNYIEGPYANTGRVHFFDKSHILDLFAKFDILRLEHKVTKIEIPENSKYTLASWNLLAKKKQFLIEAS